MFGLSVPVLAALLSVYVFWGGTYLAAKFAIETMPPTAMAAVRFIISGILMLTWSYMRGWNRVGWKEWRDAAITGCFLLCFANGSIVWAQQYVASGLVAVILGITPLWLVLLNWLWQKGRKPNALIMLGLFLGVSGIVVLAYDAVLNARGSHYLIGSGIVLAGSIFWAVGSIYSRTASQPKQPLQGVGMQMLSGGMALCLAAALMGQWPQVDWGGISTRSLIALAYLVICGSFLGFASYIWLLKNAPTPLVATYAYVNPIVAVFVGWLFAGEVLGAKEILATAIIVSAVILITIGNNRQGAA